MTPQQNPNTEILKYMKRIADSNKKRNIILRGLITGVATAVGATFGFAIVLFITGTIFSNLQQIPVVDKIIKDTGIGIIIENELNRIKAEDAAGDNTDNTDIADDPVYLKYSNEEFNIKFEYPNSLSSLNDFNVEVPEGSKPSYNIVMEGNGSLEKLTVFINPLNFEIKGDYIDEPVEVFDYANIAFFTYSKGAILNGEEINNPLYFLQVDKNENRYFFVGISNPDKPKLAKEIMTDFLKTVSVI